MEDLLAQIGMALGRAISGFFGLIGTVFDTLRIGVPGGFGLILIPLAVLGIITILVARRR